MQVELFAHPEVDGKVVLVDAHPVQGLKIDVTITLVFGQATGPECGMAVERRMSRHVMHRHKAGTALEGSRFIPLHIIQRLLWGKLQNTENEVSKANPVVVSPLHIFPVYTTEWQQWPLDDVVCTVPLVTICQCLSWHMPQRFWRGFPRCS